MTKAELDELYVRVPAAGMELGITSNAVYSALQRGTLDGLCVGGRWYVERDSVARHPRAARNTPAANVVVAPVTVLPAVGTLTVTGLAPLAKTAAE